MMSINTNLQQHRRGSRLVFILAVSSFSTSVAVYGARQSPKCQNNAGAAALQPQPGSSGGLGRMEKRAGPAAARVGILRKKLLAVWTLAAGRVCQRGKRRPFVMFLACVGVLRVLLQR
ncbi:hypothetical protein B0T14DRAFT_275094 [Immersiella caudata]|uniref:Uncharacterized protein n=1 Tax=Immersiella caudata TaxID=314043 RepID=A0AA39WLS4_9PEZI|nr:hypothetical protein B0T14DRAFT_275094 [Immersiella caudata]